MADILHSAYTTPLEKGWDNFGMQQRAARASIESILEEMTKRAGNSTSHASHLGLSGPPPSINPSSPQTSGRSRYGSQWKSKNRGTTSSRRSHQCDSQRRNHPELSLAELREIFSLDSQKPPTAQAPQSRGSCKIAGSIGTAEENRSRTAMRSWLRTLRDRKAQTIGGRHFKRRGRSVESSMPTSAAEEDESYVEEASNHPKGHLARARKVRDRYLWAVGKLEDEERMKAAYKMIEEERAARAEKKDKRDEEREVRRKARRVEAETCWAKKQMRRNREAYNRAKLQDRYDNA